ncbi:cupin-like domain-containing protein [Sphingomonas crusticola]|uniref:cupin-like domain-containing protein n=1 Tax=Sphingomonas crusticola TaxID=1697973 RepID=UPI0019684F17|nr:cupin-like domain-containing protein [Sphingomonas crusticola]
MQVRDYRGVDQRRFREEIMPLSQPAVLRGAAADWPAVRAAATPEGIAAYLQAQDTGAKFDMLVGPPAIKGRFFYNADMTGLNFERLPATVTRIANELVAAAHDAAPAALAAQAIEAKASVPAFAEENRLDLIGKPVSPRLWIGNRVVVSAHHDMFSNIAVVVAGKRRFTLFPPDQVANLHIGPFEFTPAGTPVSLIDFDAPDQDRFPGFAHALAVAQTADLEPGDAIYIPYMWWHHVRSTESFNMLANYWWNEAPPAQPGLQPVDALVHAFLAFSGLPAEQRAAWAPMFQYLVFDETAAAHMPADKSGIRGKLTEDSKRRIRQQMGALMTR